MAINRGNDYIAKFPRGKLQYSHFFGGGGCYILAIFWGDD